MKIQRFLRICIKICHSLTRTTKSSCFDTKHEDFFCICRLINHQNTVYIYQMWAMGARSGLLSVILPDGGSQFLPLFSILMPTFRGRNQRFIMECTLLWTIAGYRPQCKVSSKVSLNSIKCTPESGHVKSQNPNSWTKKSPNPRMVDTLRYS